MLIAEATVLSKERCLVGKPGDLSSVPGTRVKTERADSQSCPVSSTRVEEHHYTSEDKQNITLGETDMGLQRPLEISTS